MENLFVSHIVWSPELYREYVNAVFRKGAKAVALITASVLAAVAVCFFAEQETVPFIVCLVLSVFMFFYTPLLRNTLAKRGYKQQLLVNGGKPREVTTSFSDRIRVTSSNSGESFFDYTQITQINETKNLIILVVQQSIAVVAAKDGFTLGTTETFQQLICQKCPRVKYIYH